MHECFQLKTSHPVRGERHWMTTESKEWIRVVSRSETLRVCDEAKVFGSNQWLILIRCVHFSNSIPLYRGFLFKNERKRKTPQRVCIATLSRFDPFCFILIYTTYRCSAVDSVIRLSGWAFAPTSTHPQNRLHLILRSVVPQTINRWKISINWKERDSSTMLMVLCWL